MSSDTIYIGNLPGDVREKELDDLFHKYGEIKKIDIKNGRDGRGPAFAFVVYNDRRDAEDAVHGRDGYDFDGKRIRVEVTRGSGPRGAGGRPIREGGSRDGGFRDNRRGGFGGGRGGAPRRSDYRVIVDGLPPTGSWQDLKDHLRDAGDICYANVDRDGTGVVEFTNKDDVKYAIKKFDDTKFKSHKDETAYIRIREDKSNGRENRSRDRSRSASRSRSRSPIRRSPSRSRSPARRDRSRSGSRNQSRDVSREASPRGRRASPEYSPRSARSGSASRSPSSRRSPR